MKPTGALRLALLWGALTLAGCRSARGRDGMPDERAARTRRERVQGVTLYTAEVGDPNGSLRVVVHGGPGLDHTYLRPWLDPLGDHGRVLYVDLRGHGRSSQPADADGYTISAAAADLAALIDRINGHRPADVIAHDFGGAIALFLAARHPESVRRLVLVAPLRSASQIRTIAARSREALGDRGWSRVQALTTPQGTLRDAAQVGELFRRLGRMWWSRTPNDAVFARLARDMTYRPEADEHFLVDALVFDGPALTDDVRAPTTVISGSDDLTFPSRDSLGLADALPHGRFVEIASAGHCPFIEQNARFLDEVRRFLGSGR